MHKGLVFLLALLLPVAGQVHAADDKDYLGGAMHIGFYEETGFQRAEPTGLQLKFGHYFSPHGAIELHYVTGIEAGTVRYENINVDVDIEQGLSLFLRGELPVSAAARLYGLIGYTDGELTASATNGFVTAKSTESDAGISYGFGFEHRKPRSNMSVHLEYILYLNESGYDYSGFNLGLSHHF